MATVEEIFEYLHSHFATYATMLKKKEKFITLLAEQKFDFTEYSDILQLPLNFSENNAENWITIKTFLNRLYICTFLAKGYNILIQNMPKRSHLNGVKYYESVTPQSVLDTLQLIDPDVQDVVQIQRGKFMAIAKCPDKIVEILDKKMVGNKIIRVTHMKKRHSYFFRIFFSFVILFFSIFYFLKN